MAAIHFSCPNCRTKLSAQPDRIGTSAVCPDCRWAFYVPPANEEEPVVKFFCPFCNRKLSATADQFAREIPCPFADCGKPVLVPSPEWKPLSAERTEGAAASPRDLVARAEAINRAVPGTGEGGV